MSIGLASILLPRNVSDPAEQSRARMTLFFSAFFATVTLFVALAVAATTQTSTDQVIAVLFLMVAFVINVVAALFAQTNRWRIGGFLFTLFIVATSFTIALYGAGANFSLILVLPIIYVGVIYGVRGVAIAFTIFAIELITIGVLRSQNRLSLEILAVFNSPVLTVLLTLSMLFAAALMVTTIILEQSRLQQYSSRLFAQLRATAEVAQTTSAILQLDELLSRTVDYIRDRFGFYHVQIFLVDADRKYADLVASTGEAGQALLQRGHRLAVGSRSIIGRVTLAGEPTMASDTAEDPLHRVNELLPQTRSELALPLIAGDKLIGALDVQSTRPNAFSQEDIDSLQIMATQVGIAVRNAQLFDEQRKALNENRRLFLEAETSLREIERLNQRLTGGAWDEFLRERQAPYISLTLRDNDLVEDNTWTVGLQQAAEKRRPVIMTENTRHTIAVPIELRGQILGAVEVEVTEQLRQSDMLEMLQAIAGRLALNLDNARLFEEAQKAAQQELEINTLTTKMQGVTEVDDLLKTIVAELARALGADQAAIRLGTPPTANGSGNGYAALNSGSATTGNGHRANGITP